jgi:hypothetical protein
VIPASCSTLHPFKGNLLQWNFPYPFITTAEVSLRLWTSVFCVPCYMCLTYWLCLRRCLLLFQVSPSRCHCGSLKYSKAFSWIVFTIHSYLHIWSVLYRTCRWQLPEIHWGPETYFLFPSLGSSWYGVDIAIEECDRQYVRTLLKVIMKRFIDWDSNFQLLTMRTPS